MKMITRTIFQYDHMLVKFNEGTFDEKHIILAEKLGSRKMAAYINDNGLDGYTLVKVSKVPVKYGMSLDIFMEHANIIEDEEEEA